MVQALALLSCGDMCCIFKGSCSYLIRRGGRHSVGFYSYGFICPLNTWDVGERYPDLLVLKVSFGVVMRGLCSTKEASFSVEAVWKPGAAAALET